MNYNKVKKEKLTILLVEDDPAHAELVKRSLTKHQTATEIIHLADGQTALDYLLAQNAYADPDSCPRPHVILLDLRLPVLDGLSVLKKIKESEKLRKIPVIVLTTSESEWDIAKAYGCHANNYLIKPVDFNEFSELMEDIGYYCGWIGQINQEREECHDQ
ncbi:MAG: response regulator [Phycisphaerae bacterium]|nr:response regulator [Phycisphaerae bacterium]